MRLALYAWSHASTVRGLCTVSSTSGGIRPPKRSFMKVTEMRFELRNCAEAACVHCSPTLYRPTSYVVAAAGRAEAQRF